MPFQQNYRIVGAMIILLIGVTFSAVLAIEYVNSSQNSSTPILDVTLLTNAGVMIETDDIRIYIDPISLNASYENYPADIVCVTHPHGDHYDPSSLDIIGTESTTFIFPANMSAEVALYDATPVVPGDTILVGDVNITAFYMYTLPVGEFLASHPREANWTSYIIDIDGFVIFHAGDSKNIVEYHQLTDLIDLALLPLGPGCQTMANYEVVEALDTINPTYFIPIHYQEGTQDIWIAAYDDDVENLTDCTPIVLDYWSMHSFELP